jgi:hypothetical protein
MMADLMVARIRVILIGVLCASFFLSACSPRPAPTQTAPLLPTQSGKVDYRGGKQAMIELVEDSTGI